MELLGFSLNASFLQGLILGGLVCAFISYVYYNKKRSVLEEENIRMKAELAADDGNLDKITTLVNQFTAEQTTKSNSEIKKTLEPLKENINNFKNRLEDLDKQRVADSSAIREHITNLQQTSNQVSEEASNLVNALRGDKKAQGDWGEVILERLLESSGLEKDREYFIQQSVKGEDGSIQRPDVIIKLPDNKNIIIDSKVSLNAYNDYCNAEDEASQNEFIQKHIKAIGNHIQTLSAKDYEKSPDINSLDYTLMFVPIEVAFLVALKADPNLFEKGISKNIILVAPTTLLSTLKVIHNLWRNEKRVMNAQKIATEGGKLYDKFAGFIEDMEKLGKSLGQAKDSFESAKKKLHTGRGDLLTQSDKMSKSAKGLLSKDDTSANGGDKKKVTADQDEETSDDTSIVSSMENMKELGADAKKTIPNQL